MVLSYRKVNPVRNAGGVGVLGSLRLSVVAHASQNFGVESLTGACCLGDALMGRMLMACVLCLALSLSLRLCV